MLFFLLLKVEMPIIVGISPFMSRKNFMLIRVEYEKNFITSGPEFRGMRCLACQCFVTLENSDDGMLVGWLFWV